MHARKVHARIYRSIDLHQRTDRRTKICRAYVVDPPRRYTSCRIEFQLWMEYKKSFNSCNLHPGFQVRFADTAAEEKKKYRVCFDCCDARRRPFPTHVRVTTGRLDWTGPYCILFVYSISPSAMNNDRERDADAELFQSPTSYPGQWRPTCVHYTEDTIIYII